MYEYNGRRIDMIFSRKAKQAEYIVDVHCHILPGIDDGSRSMEETLKMLRIAADEGITHVIQHLTTSLNIIMRHPDKLTNL